jgi:hypothetical protein
MSNNNVQESKNVETAENKKSSNENFISTQLKKKKSKKEIKKKLP